MVLAHINTEANPQHGHCKFGTKSTPFYWLHPYDVPSSEFAHFKNSKHVGLCTKNEHHFGIYINKLGGDAEFVDFFATLNIFITSTAKIPIAQPRAISLPCVEWIDEGRIPKSRLGFSPCCEMSSEKGQYHG
ncbi:hypothetical protein R1flu_004340 [Riccia fluitans]|uniref:Uncharacterized protein n=1 Tax=Riccia fluitans TaxID=41844 RepID=A0ABD1YQ15_9MARC